jgi:hypothetical protein
LNRKPWLFAQVPAVFWDKKENQKEFLQWFSTLIVYYSNEFSLICSLLFLGSLSCRLEKDFQITNPEDWYRVTQQDVLDKVGHCGLFRKVGPMGVEIPSIHI